MGTISDGKLGRRSFLEYAALAVGAASLTGLAAACGQPAPAQPTAAPAAKAEPTKPGASGAQLASQAQAPVLKPTPAPGATSIRFYTWTAAANLPNWTAAVEAFMRKYPKIQVTLEHTPGQAYWDKLTVEYAGGNPPDVIYASPLDCGRVGNQGMLLDLTQYIKDDKYNLDDLNPVAQKPYMWGGKIFGLVAFTDSRITFYNKTLFRQAGLPELPQTWDGEFSLDQFITYCQKLTDPSKQTWGFVFESQSQAARMTWLFGAKYYDSDDYPTKAVMDSPEGIQGFQWVQDLVHKYKVAPSLADNMGGSDPMFQTGKVGMVWGGFKSAAAVHTVIKDFEWGVSTIPKGAARVSNVSPNGFMVVSKTKAPAESWQLVRYNTADEGNVFLSRSTSMPANRNVDFSKVSSLPAWQNKLLQDALKTGRSEVPHPNIKPQFGTIITEEMDNLMAKTKTGEQVAKDMAKRINDAFQPYVVPR